jgi:glycosyltransferase involved in cell wall biosynthesis
MACGCPTVVANTSGLAEIVADGGLLVDPADFDGIVRTLSSLLMSPERRAELARAGLLRAAKFSWARAAQQTVAVFEELLGLPIVATSERVASELIPAEVS